MDTIYNMAPCGPRTPIGVRVMFGLVGAPHAGFSEMEQKLIGQSGRKYGWKKEDIIKAFIEHNEHVKATCPPDKLLVFEAKDGWEPLCKFLNLPIPNVPYPHVNDTEEFRKIINTVNVVGIVVGVLGLGIPFLFVPPMEPSAKAYLEDEEKKKL